MRKLQVVHGQKDTKSAHHKNGTSAIANSGPDFSELNLQPLALANSPTFNCHRYIPVPVESRTPAIAKVRIFDPAKTTPTASSGSVFAGRIYGLWLRHLPNFQLEAV